MSLSYIFLYITYIGLVCELHIFISSRFNVSLSYIFLYITYIGLVSELCIFISSRLNMSLSYCLCKTKVIRLSGLPQAIQRVPRWRQGNALQICRVPPQEARTKGGPCPWGSIIESGAPSPGVINTGGGGRRPLKCTLKRAHWFVHKSHELQTFSQ